jgi:hypothetical protein
MEQLRAQRERDREELAAARRRPTSSRAAAGASSDSAVLRGTIGVQSQGQGRQSQSQRQSQSRRVQSGDEEGDFGLGGQSARAPRVHVSRRGSITISMAEGESELLREAAAASASAPARSSFSVGGATSGAPSTSSSSTSNDRVQMLLKVRQCSFARKFWGRLLLPTSPTHSLYLSLSHFIPAHAAAEGAAGAAAKVQIWRRLRVFNRQAKTDVSKRLHST